MSDVTIPSGDTLILNASLTSNFSFPTTGSAPTDLVIEPSALSVTLVGITTAVTAIELGGNIQHFGPNDTIVLADATTDFSNFDTSPSAPSDVVTFQNIASLAVSQDFRIYASDGLIITDSPLINLEYGPTLNTSLAPFINAIEQSLFGSIPSTGTLTISVGLSDFGDSAAEPGPPSESGGYAFTITTGSDINPCFAAGTQIRTPAGETPVESLRAGDTVLTAAGAERRVVWIGRRTLDLSRHPRPELVRPVRIAAGALADGVPARDLVVSPDHALFLDGVLVQAKDLVDGTMIAPDRRISRVTYFHVELDRHDVLLAEGAPAESFLDTGHRGLFENAGEPITLHPDLMQARREAEGCAPLVTGGDALAAIRARLAARRAAQGFALVRVRPALRHGDLIIEASEERPGTFRFALPANATEFELLAGTFVPAEVDPVSTDRRRLGLSVAGLALDGAALDLETAIPAPGRLPRAGGDAGVWTSGNAGIRLPRAGAELVLTLTAQALFWTAPAAMRRASA
ncbi:Hint domain-containing protein [Acidiphilium multivorum]|uniref:Hint domain-containing protein n=1 Tax=Acidiphilium multivorum TaxID=62140 RepID=UPI001F4C07BE|nr:Hint domain-containing protein [Acidiphilium multivorum]UNC14997.1 Hint domain-containing protein [Acidiphilium multivorum]